MSLSKEQILSSNDLKTIEVEIPEWDGTVLLKELSGRERDEFEEMCFKESKGGKIDIDQIGLKVKILSFCAVDENGDRLFTLDDVEALNKKNGAAINKLYEEAQKLTKLTGVDIEELAKNSKSDLSADSGSGSQDS